MLIDYNLVKVDGLAVAISCFKCFQFRLCINRIKTFDNFAILLVFNCKTVKRIHNISVTTT